MIHDHVTKCLGMEHKTSEKGPYVCMAFLDGTKAVDLMVDRSVVIPPDLKPFDDVILTIDVNLGYYKGAKIIGVQK